MSNLKRRYTKVARVASELTRQALAKYSPSTNPLDFTTPQLAACVVLARYLDISYSDAEEWLHANKAVCRVLDLPHVPDRNTLLHAYQELRFLDFDRISQLLLEQLGKSGRPNDLRAHPSRTPLQAVSNVAEGVLQEPGHWLKTLRILPTSMGPAIPYGPSGPTAGYFPVQRVQADKLRSRFVVIRALLLLSAAVLLWAVSLPNIDPSQMTDLGLISVMPIAVYAALAILIISFCMLVFQADKYEPLLYLHVIALIVFIHGMPMIVYGTLRYSWAWKHVGIIDYIQRHGTVDPGISLLNAYHNWPGFFILNALITDTMGVSSALAYAGWGPVFFNLIDIGALLLILRSLTTDKRLIWLAVWFFYFANWVGQDYFSPQATTYFLYLLVVGICLRCFKVLNPPSRLTLKHWLKFEWLISLYSRLIIRNARDDAPQIQFQAIQRLALFIILILFFMVIASSHQLTPFMLISALVGLVITRRIRLRSLPVLMGIFTAAWMIYMAITFLNGNINEIVQSIALLTNNFNSNLINLEHASPGQALVAIMDRIQTASFIGLALFGALRRIRHGYWDVTAALLCVSPVVMLVLSSYGGEILFRVIFFAFPFLAFFAATLFYTSPKEGKSRKSILFSVLTTCGLLVGFCFGYYGKESQYYFTKDEVAAAQAVDNVAPPGALIADGTWDWPLQYRNYELHQYESLADANKSERQDLFADPPRVIERMMREYPAAYVVITRSQKADVDETGILPAGSLETVEQDLLRSPDFKIFYQSPHAVVFVLRDSLNGVEVSSQ